MLIWNSYKDASDAVKRKQDKEREAAGLGPVQRMGAKASPATQRGRGGRGGAVVARGRGGGASSAPRTINMGADKNLYVHLVGLLKKKNLLPVVVFTLSKKRCEENASTLTNQDLCSGVEKSEVHVAIEKALSRLKGKWCSLTLPAQLNKVLIQVLTRSCLRSRACVTCFPEGSVCIMGASFLWSKRYAA